MSRLPLFLLMFLLCASPALAGETVLLSNGEWPPYFSEKFKYGGVGSRIVTEAFALEGIKVKYDYMPWKRGLASARLGDHVGAVGWRITPERDEYFYSSDPVFEAKSVFFHRRDVPFEWETLKDVGRMNIGVTLGYSYDEMLAPVVEKYGGKLDLAPTDVINLQKLVAGRIEVFPCGEAVGNYLLKTQFSHVEQQITHHPKPILTGGLHLLVSRKISNGRMLIVHFNRGLEKLKECGLYDQYLEESLRGEYIPE